MNDIIWAGIVIFITIVAVLFIVLYFTALATLVRPTECSSSTGTYGVRPNKTGTVVSTTNNVSLGEAIDICDQDSTCTTFSYSGVGRFMNIIDVTKPIVDATTLDLYQSRITK